MLWEKAPNKVPVAITIQGGSGRLENLGTLQVDMDCPVYIARNILMQALGSKLNDGTGFKFLSQGKAVSTQDEKNVARLAFHSRTIRRAKKSGLSRRIRRERKRTCGHAQF